MEGFYSRMDIKDTLRRVVILIVMEGFYSYKTADDFLPSVVILVVMEGFYSLMGVLDSMNLL